jgi:long-chain acyl-CoA synthetase
VSYTTFTDLSQKSEVCRLVKTEIDRINQTLPQGVRIKKYVNLHKEFDPDEGELTRTRKLRKTFLEERYRELIDAIYSDRAEVPIEARARYQDGRMGTIKTTLSIKSVEGDTL